VPIAIYSANRRAVIVTEGPTQFVIGPNPGAVTINGIRGDAMIYGTFPPGYYVIEQPLPGSTCITVYSTRAYRLS
jgi:hypothetical protein